MSDQTFARSENMKLLTVVVVCAALFQIGMVGCSSSDNGGTAGTGDGSGGSGGIEAGPDSSAGHAGTTAGGSAGSAGTTAGGSAGSAGTAEAGSAGTAGTAAGGSAGEGPDGGLAAQVVPCAGSTPAVTIDATMPNFNPATATVAVNDVVEFHNTSIMGHTATSGIGGTPPQPDGKFDTGTIAAGASACVQFLIAGSYPYYCAVHPVSMQATITVQ